jgi:hypothetical protein
MTNQINLAALGLPTLSEEALKLIKKLSKLTGHPESEYTSMSEEELAALLDSEQKKIELIKKKKDDLAKLKSNLIELESEYDEELSYEENEEVYKELMDEKKALLAAEEDRKTNPKYKYPFRIYFKGCDIQEPDHIFETDAFYTAKEIVSRLFKAGYKEFAGAVKVNYDSQDNMIIPEFTSQRHG